MAVDLPALFEMPKRLSAPAKWIADETDLIFVAPLEDADGVTIRGLQLRGRTKGAYPDRDLSLLLEHQPVLGRPFPIARLDWNPFHTHNNKNRGPKAYRLLKQTGSHHHAFALNWNPDKGEMRKTNLPIAVPLSKNPATFYDLLALLSKEFRISAVHYVANPPWQANLT